jgi:hypothetical protein
MVGLVCVTFFVNTACVSAHTASVFIKSAQCMFTSPFSRAHRLQITHKSFKAPKRAPAFQMFEDDELSAARSLVAEEEMTVQLELAQAADGTLPSNNDIAVMQDDVRMNYAYLPAGQVVKRSAATALELRLVLETEFSSLGAHYAREKSRLDRLQQRLTLLTKGYEERSASLNRSVFAAASERVDEQIKFSCFVALAKGEAAAVPARLAATETALAEVLAQERELQARYASSLREIDSLRLQLVTAGVEV